MSEYERLTMRVAALQMRLEALEGVRFSRRAEAESSKARKALSDREVLEIVCAEVGITCEEVRGSSRTREVSQRRAVVAGILRRNLEWGVRRIGRAMAKSPASVKGMMEG